MANILFENLPTRDLDGNIVVDVTQEPLAGTRDPVIIKEYELHHWDYNSTECFLSEDKKDPSRMWIIPIKDKTIYSPFGDRIHPIYGTKKHHNGVDLGSPGCSPILAARAGEVSEASFFDGNGHYVIIDHYENDDVTGQKDGFQTVYLHMGPATKRQVGDTWVGIPGAKEKYEHIVTVGQKVAAGQIIGSVGTSGTSTGPHLHFEIRINNSAKNPEDYINFSTTTTIDASVSFVTRVQKEARTHEDFVPIYSDKNTESHLGGGPHQHHIRRGQLISDCSIPLFDYGKLNKKIGAGTSSIGMSDNNVVVLKDVPTKQEVEKLYWDEDKAEPTNSKAFGFPSSSENLDDNKLIKVAKYIFSKLVNTYNWSSEAAFAVLGNMAAESGLNPAMLEVGGTGFGLIQWTPGDAFKKKARKEEYGSETEPDNEEEKKKWKKIPYDIDVQLKYIGKLDGWYNSYSLSGFYSDHIGSYLTNINPDDPKDVTAQIFTGYNSDPVPQSFTKSTLWTNYYKGDKGEVERRKTYSELKSYYDTGKVLGISSDTFKKSQMGIGTLAIIYSVNLEMPHKYALFPWKRVGHAYTMEYYLGKSLALSVGIDGKDANFDKSVNPYISGKYNNNAYAWAKAMKILYIVKDKEDNNLLCKDSTKNWYEYNRTEKKFEFGLMPRKYSIACWKYKGQDGSEATRTAIVEQVTGTDVITISEYPHGERTAWNDKSFDKVTTKTITNPDYNWGQDKSKYKFLGFIYLLEDSFIRPGSIETESDGSITVLSTSSQRCSSLTFGTVDIKHYNRVRVIYDINVYKLEGKESELTGSINLMASQQIINCSRGDKEWNKTGFNELPPNEGETIKYNHNLPFPYGAILLETLDIKDYIDKGIVHRDKTFRINKCNLDGNANASSFHSNKYQVFDREQPLYICITPVSYEENNYNKSATVEVTIKKILLYR